MELASLVEVKTNPHVPQIRTGDTVRVSVKVVEGDRERIQNFQGLVIRMRRGGIASNFTVRRVAYGVGVERTFFLTSPRLEKVEVLRHGKVRRANLYYLRKLSGKAAQLKERRGLKDLELKAEDEIAEPEASAEAALAEPEAVAETTVTETKAVAEKTAAEPKAVAKKTAKEPKAVVEKTAAEPKASAEVTAAETKAGAEVPVAEKKASAEVTVAETKDSAEVTVAETKASAEVAPTPKPEQPQAVKEEAAPEVEKST